MEDVSHVYLSPLPDSPYVKPFRMNYTQCGKDKSWDLLEVHDSVAVVVFNITRRVLIFVKQFRPAIYYNCIPQSDRDKNNIDTEKYSPALGVSLEICAGIVDKDISLEAIAQEELLEECGYNVQIKALEKVMTYRAGVGVQGAVQTLYYCEVTDDMKTEQGGGIGDEIIEVIEMTIPEVEKMLTSDTLLNSPPSCLMALMWFMRHKADKYGKSKDGTGET